MKVNKDLELANAYAMIREAIELIEGLLPGFSKTSVNVGKLNDWLLRSRDYNHPGPQWQKDFENNLSNAIECPGCKEITLVKTGRRNTDMWECVDCGLEQMFKEGKS